MVKNAMQENPPFTDDAVLDGRVRLRQPLAGYRAGADAALLAAACDAGAGESVLDVGCGVGAALLAAAVRRPEARFTGLERDAGYRAFAEQNIELNSLSERVSVREGDVALPFSKFSRIAFDAVIANPPFFDDEKALRAPSPARRGAWIADAGLPGWTAFLLKAVRERGTITVIHRADRLGDLLALLSEKAGSFKVRPIHPFADAPAKRVLIRAIKTGKAPLQVLPALVMHERGGARHTAEAEAILRGKADLPWG
jgi:tRNA1(Val) A37 N6-methylase TrmN6